MATGKESASIVKTLGEKILSGGSFFLLDVTVSTGAAPKIRVVIDGDNGVSIDDCAKISRELNEAFEGSGLPDDYSLEVTTPGVDQPLKFIRQYNKHAGRSLKIILKDGQTIRGKLLSADQDVIRLEREAPKKNTPANELQTEIVFQEIEKTFVQISFK
jgi:ribosome maturation factor RimP